MKNVMNWTKAILKGCAYSLFLLVSVATLLEIIFRILPTSDSLQLKAVNTENKILRLKENRDVTKQIGFNFQHTNVKHINNYGFATDRDFTKKELQNKPIIAVIGDSYVEAFHVKNQDTFHAILDSELQQYDVYPIGISGSPLSQYIAFARFAESEFAPNLYLMLIIENDFDESFYDVKKAPGFHYFNTNGGLDLIEYQPSLVKRIARESAFLRYLHLDLKLSAQFSRMLTKNNISNDFSADEDNNFLRKGYMAIDKFLVEISKLTEKANVVLLLDGDRNAIYNGMGKRDMSKAVNILFDKLMERAKPMHKVDILDLHDYFHSNWSIHKKMFNYDYDFHWNEHGHAVVAQALQEKIFTTNIPNKEF